MADLEFEVTFQKETKAFLVYEQKEGDRLKAIVYLARTAFLGSNPTNLRVKVSR